MIIVEGPDGSGKTTLVTKLAERYSLGVEPKLVNSDMSSNSSKKAWCEQNVARGFQAKLFDRHCLISEPIYNSVTRRAFDPGFDDVHWYTAMTTMFYKHCNPLIIYCLPELEVVKANVAADVDNQPKVVRESIRKIYAQYVAKAASDVALAGALVYQYQSTPDYLIFKQVSAAVERMFHV